MLAKIYVGVEQRYHRAISCGCWSHPVFEIKCNIFVDIVPLKPSLTKKICMLLRSLLQIHGLQGLAMSFTRSGATHQILPKFPQPSIMLSSRRIRKYSCSGCGNGKEKGKHSCVEKYIFRSCISIPSRYIIVPLKPLLCWPLGTGGCPSLGIIRISEHHWSCVDTWCL